MGNGINLSNIKNNKRTVEVDYFGDKFNVGYQPSVLTPAKETEIREKSTEGDNKALVSTMCEMITSWEVLGADDKPIPIDEETLTNLPSAFLGAILQTCREDMAPKSKNGRK